MTLAAGVRLGPYEILSPLGAGGMGEVYRARDTRLGRAIAIKVLPERLASDPEAMARFEREARAVAGLSHPNILALHDFGSDGSVSFAVMELLEGETLREELRNGRVPARKASDYARQIAEGLAAAHEKGVIHRDLKPENLFLTKDGRVKILDFGLARIALFDESADTHSPTAAVATEPGTILGTVGYMSPEQVRGNAADGRSDIFALGAVLYEMLTGRRAFARETTAETMTAILREEPEDSVASASGVSPALDHIVRRCLEKKPEQRFQSARDLAFALSETGGFSSVSGAVAGPAATHPGFPRRSAVLAAAGLLLAAAAFFAGRRMARPSGAADGWRFEPLTFGTPASLPSISPDGRQVLFVRREGKENDVFLQRIGGQNAVNLTRGTGFDNSEPAFSPDGARVAFHSERDDGGIYVMGATGESVRRVVPKGFAPSWSPDGSSLVYSTADDQDPYHLGASPDIEIVDVESGARRVLRAGGSKERLVRPVWSPHGKRIAVFGIVGSGSQRDIFTLDATAKNPQPVRLIDDKPLDWAPVWSPDGKFLYFGSDRGGTLDLYRIGIDETTGKATSKPERVSVPAEAAGPFSLSADGSRIVFEADSASFGIQRLMLDPGRREVVGAPRTILTGLPPTPYLDVSPDGRRLLFQAGMMRETLYTADSNGGDLTQVTDDEFKNRQPRWIAGGKRILFYSTRGGPYQLWGIGSDGSEAKTLTRPSIGELTASVPTADGERIATFLESRESARLAVLRRQPDGSFVPENLRNPPPADSYAFPVAWSPDERRLLVYGPAGMAIWVPESGVVESITRAAIAGAWISDDLLIYGEMNTADLPGGSTPGSTPLVLYDRATKEKRLLYNFPGEVSLGGEMALSPDRRSLYVLTSLSRSEIWLMQRTAPGR